MLKGPQSPLYGSDAAAGVVNFLPDIGRPGEAPTFAARFRGGSHSTFEEVFKLKGGAEKSGYAATLSRLDTDGHLPNDGYSRSVGTLALDYFFSDKAKARLLYHANRNGYDVPGPDHRNYAEPNTSPEEPRAAHRRPGERPPLSMARIRPARLHVSARHAL